MFNPLHLWRLVSAPWRLCPSLDSFTDDECLPFVAAAWKWRQWGLSLAFVLALTTGLTFMAAVVVVFDRCIPRTSVWSDSEAWQGRAFQIGAAAIWIPLVLSMAFTPYQWCLRHAVDRLLARAVCGKCLYSLQGLRVENGSVRCPECGTVTTLAEAGLTPEAIALGRPVVGKRVTPIAPGYGPYWYIPIASVVAVGPVAAWFLLPGFWFFLSLAVGWVILLAGPRVAAIFRKQRE